MPRRSVKNWNTFLLHRNHEPVYYREIMTSLPPFLRLGLIGLPGVVTLNLVALLFLDQPAAAFFSDRWWPTWFTSYLIWGVFLIVGVGQAKIHRT